MAQERLFRLAVESGSVTFRHEPGRGWHLVIWLRRGDEVPDEVQPDVYDRLTTVELLGIIDRVLDDQL
jgi:translation initiation factor IF-1